MGLAVLTRDEVRTAQQVVFRSCSLDFLESFLSEEDILLTFQTELSRLSKGERHRRLAEIIVLVLGDQILRYRLVREKLCEQAGIPVPPLWKPGTKEAMGKCRQLGLPAVFAGTLPPPKPFPITRLGVVPEFKPLFDYQVEVIDRARNALRHGKSALISLPTGSGKTRVATELLLDWHLNSRGSATTLWVAHTEELCEQAIACISERWESERTRLPATVFRCWGPYYRQLVAGNVFDEASFKDLDQHLHVFIVSTPQTARKLLGGSHPDSSIIRALNNPLLVVIDEAHRGAAPTYRAVYRLAQNIAKNSKPLLLGLSATPVRATYSSEPYEGTRELSSIFEELVEPLDTIGTRESPIVVLGRIGILAQLQFETLDLNLDEPDELADAVRIKRSSSTASPALLFCQTVAEAKAVAAYLHEMGVASDYVSANSTWSERRRIIENLREGDTEVLCNCELLTTGFDAPRVGQIFLARPTRSPILYKQMLGRGLRGPKIGGGATCDVYLCGITLPFPLDPNTSEFARAVWQSKSLISE